MYSSIILASVSLLLPIIQRSAVSVSRLNATWLPDGIAKAKARDELFLLFLPSFRTSIMIIKSNYAFAFVLPIRPIYQARAGVFKHFFA